MGIFFVLVPLLVLGAIALGVFVLFSGKSDLTKKVSALDQSKPSLFVSKQDAAVDKLLAGERRTKLQRQLLEAGMYDDTPTKVVIRAAIGGVIAGAVGFLLGFFVMHASPTMSFMLTLLPFVYGLYRPFAQIKTAIKVRRQKILQALPNLLDMLASTVSAGLALNGALQYAVEAIHGPLGEEVSSTLSDIRLGAPRGEALLQMAARCNVPDLTGSFRAIVQAEKMGTNMAQMLSELADDSRARRLLRAEEIAAALPVKMTLPMVLFMLPALFSVIFGMGFGEYASPFIDAVVQASIPWHHH
jgi:tight adherence protein C